MRSPSLAILWEVWRVTRVEAAWKLALGSGAGIVILVLSYSQREIVKDANAAIALIGIVIPHLIGWLSMGRLNNGRAGFPLSLHYTHPVRTTAIVALPMAYLTALSSAIYLVSALLLRATSGHAFPLLPVAMWMAALTVIGVAATWSTRNRSVQVNTMVSATAIAFLISMQRLTAVEIPDNYDWPPRLWPTLFDWPLYDYAVIALIGVASFGITVAGVARQRRGDGWAEVLPAQPVGLWEGLVDMFRLPCPTSSAARAQVWFDLKSNGLPLLTIGVALASVILLVSAVSGPIDAALNANPSVHASCPLEECFYTRTLPPLLTPFSLFVMLFLGRNAFGIRSRQGRTYVGAFEATQPQGAVQMAALKLLVRSACLLTALLAIGVSAWISLPLLGDAVFIQMWGVPLSSGSSVVKDAVAALTGYEQLSLAVVAAVGVVVWVAGVAGLGALWTRYSRRVNVAASSLLLSGLAFAFLAVAERNGSVSPVVIDTIFVAARWAAAAAIVGATVYLYRSCLAERTLTPRYALGALLVSAAFVAAWVALLRAAGVQFASMPWTSVGAALVWPLCLPLFTSALAPWSYSRVRVLGVAALLWIGTGSNIVAQTPAGPAFEVASVKPSNPNPDPNNPLSMIALMLPQPGGRFTATNTPLRMLIMAAYELKQEAQLVGGSPALLAAKYDITARAADTATPWMKELPQLLRSLLADRFKLKAHTESRELPLYDLVLARSDGRLGPELKASTSDCSKAAEIGAEQAAALAKGDATSFVGKPRPCSVSTDTSGGPLNLLMRGDGQEMKSLVEVLSQFTGRTVRDKTGLTGRYDFAMKLDLQMVLALAQKMGANVPAAAANIPQAEGSSLMTTLNEQLGLKLESTRDGVTVVVIDGVEAASED